MAESIISQGGSSTPPPSLDDFSIDEISKYVANNKLAPIYYLEEDNSINLGVKGRSWSDIIGSSVSSINIYCNPRIYTTMFNTEFTIETLFSLMNGDPESIEDIYTINYEPHIGNYASELYDFTLNPRRSSFGISISKSIEFIFNINPYITTSIENINRASILLTIPIKTGLIFQGQPSTSFDITITILDTNFVEMSLTKESFTINLTVDDSLTSSYNNINRNIIIKAPNTILSKIQSSNINIDVTSDNNINWNTVYEELT